MSATFRWMVKRRLLTATGFVVILLGAFIPWGSLAISAVVIVLGAVLLVVQMPIAWRDATEELDSFDEPEEHWQAPAYPQYQPEQYQQPMASLQPEPSSQVVETTPVWQPTNIPQFQQAAPYVQPVPSQFPEPSTRTYEPAPAWKPTSTPQAPEPSEQPRPSQLPEPTRRMYEPAPVWQPSNIPQSPQPEPSLQPEPSSRPEPSRRVDEPAVPWRPQNIPQYRPKP